MKYYNNEKKKLNEIYSSSEKSIDSMSPYNLGILSIFEILKLSQISDNNKIMSFFSVSILILSSLYILFLRFSHQSSKKAANKGLNILTNSEKKYKYDEDLKIMLFKCTKILNLICETIFIVTVLIFIVNLMLFFKYIIS